MNNFNVPLMAESSSSNIVSYAASNNDNNNHQQHHHQQQQPQQQQHLQHHHQQHQQQQLLPHHHKDQMLAAGSTPMIPFITYTQLQKDAQQQQQQQQQNSNSNPPVDSFSTLQAINDSQLDGGVSLSGLCERIFASPNPHSNSNHTPSNNNNNNNTNNNNNNVDDKLTTPSSGGVINNGAVIIESVTMPSFANLLFNNNRNNHNNHNNHSNNNNQATVNGVESLNSIDPVLLQKSNTMEYHQLKPLENVASSAVAAVVSTSSFLSSTTAQLLDFEVVATKDTSVVVVAGNGIADTTTTAAPAAAATTTTTANRSSLHSIEELAASSCATNKTTSNNTTSTTQQQQLHHQQQQQQQAGNLSGSNLSSDDESMSEDEFGLEIDDHGGYQETNSSHSQQSGNGAAGNGNANAGNSGQLLNGTGGGSSGGNGYMLLPPAGGGGGGNNSASGASHMSGNIGSGGGAGGGAGTTAGSGHHGGTSATSGGGEAIDFKHLFEELCPVCGDKVSGYHYGLLTCESCKGFFKRTVQNKKVYTCVAERSCHIDKTQRKRCPYCRFQKCLEVGMKLEAVRADRMRGGRNKFGPMYKRDRARKLQVMRQRQLALQALRSSMGSDIKPTPLSPGYQQAYPNMNIKQEIQIPQVSSLTQSPDSSPSPIAIALGQVNASGGGVIATPMNAGNVSGGNGNGSSSLGSGNNNNNNTNNNSSSSTGSGGSAGGGGGGGGGGNNAGGGGGGNNAGGGGGGNNNNSNNGDGLLRNGNGSNGNSNSSCHETGTGSLQNSAESKLCFDSGTHPSSTADALIEPLRVSPMIREFVQSIDDREWQTQLFALLQKQTYNQVEVDLFELMCKVLDQNLFSQVDWARNTVFFKDLKVDDQMKLLQHSWSDMLVLDHLHHRIHNGLPDTTQLNNGQVFNLMSLGLLGVPQLGDYFNELQNKLQDLKFDMGDYVCMKFLILLNPDVRGIVNKKTVLEGHESVQAALLDYTLTCYPSVNDKFRRLLNILPEIHAMAARGEEHLYSKHCAGSAPTQTLLMEMLHAKRKV
ncbi:nuclear hormone receptor FTZ-F1 [Drosophila innubila]|uniref:nuclear hormone receptor FTZ-F1 n=1 Tax=Drosophila innubila TaxID=198719 RepID=UPI00148C2224|nr:nuclear hormone receptor FTZ-F1 [Drosophila innubila]